MLLWVLFALLTAAALAAVLAPLARPAREAGAGAGAQAVYRHQLDEIEAERVRGTLPEGEAAAARNEVSRRLLAAAAAEEADCVRRRPLAAAPTRLAALLAGGVPLLALCLYLVYGSPGMPASSAVGHAGLSPEGAPIGALIAKVEARLREAPEDGEGWDVIAPIYLRLGRFAEAADAYARAARLMGATVTRLSGLAEASVAAHDGLVAEAARQACLKIVAIEPGHMEARFFLALAKEQEGKRDAALAEYQALLAEAPADAPWRGALAQRIAQMNAREAPIGQPFKGPSAEQMAAAGKLSSADRASMIAQMVDGLAERLKHDAGDLAGWQRLIHAYAVLGRAGDARRALAEARKQFAADPKALGQLATLAKSLGLDS